MSKTAQNNIIKYHQWGSSAGCKGSYERLDSVARNFWWLDGWNDQDRGPTLHKSIARQDHLLMIAETRTIESRGSKQAARTSQVM